MSNNIDMNSLLSALSKMDKNDLKQSLEKANKILNSTDKKNIIDALKKDNN